jgi:hypothetical protein
MLAGRRYSVESEGGLQQLREFRDLERPWSLSPRQQCLQCAAGQDRVPDLYLRDPARPLRA